MLEGWEVKAIRANQAHLKEAYVIVAAARSGCSMRTSRRCKTASTHIHPTRRVPASCCCTPPRSTSSSARSSAPATRWCRSTCTTCAGRIKLEIGLAKGKRQFEKRDAEQKKDWKREQNRLLKQRTR